MNKKFQVLADSTCDLPLEFRQENDIDYLKMVFTINDKQYDADLDWSEISFEEFYNQMRAGKRSVTGLVKRSELEDKFEKYLNQGLDILYITCSSRLSGSINSAKIVAGEFQQKYPDRKIICLDSLRSCFAQGMMAICASNLAKQGKDIEEVNTFINEEKLKYNCWATVGTLDYMKRAGRVKASTAFFGNLFRIKPIVMTDATGANTAYKKSKRRMESLSDLVDLVSEQVVDPAETTFYIEHADCYEDALHVEDLIKERINPKAVSIQKLGPIIGSTTGPDTIVINFYGKKVTFVGE